MSAIRLATDRMHLSLFGGAPRWESALAQIEKALLLSPPIFRYFALALKVTYNSAV